jgi:hypothetical protein
MVTAAEKLAHQNPKLDRNHSFPAIKGRVGGKTDGRVLQTDCDPWDRFIADCEAFRASIVPKRVKQMTPFHD